MGCICGQQEWIDVRVLQESSQLILHSSELQILTVSVKPLMENETLEALPFPEGQIRNYNYHDNWNKTLLLDPESGTVRVFAQLRAGVRYRLHFLYKGHLSNTLTGFYKSSYKDSHNKTRWLASTTFEPNEARRAFPCFDEPGFKARFQVNLASRDDAVALSNMPRRSLHNKTGARGWVWNRFEETPPMSPYLVAFFVGWLESRETRTANGTPFRVWARPEVMAQTQYALDIGPRILDFFSSLLGVPDPLPKQDVLALPHFVADALENWGLVSFGEKYLLHDVGVSPASRKQQVASIVSHELAHSWFGNMVSVSWWEDIWLNEGFATYFSAMGTNHVDPKWDTFSVTSVTAFLKVFSVDSLQSSHALTIPIGHQSELRQIFDTLTYYKGYYLLRMLNHTLGQETFLSGCRQYIRQHKFGVVNQRDLWKALTLQAHKNGSLAPGLELYRLMNTWTLRPGFPVVTVGRNYTTRSATVTQARFERPMEDVEARVGQAEFWWVPITYTSEPELDFDSTRPRLWLDPAMNETNLTDMPGPDHWVLFNVQAAGLYRVNYDLRNWKLISEFLNSNKYTDISVLNRALLLDDAMNLARVGLLPYEVALNVSSYLHHETHYLPWKAALHNLDYIARMLRLTDGITGYRRFILYLVQPQFRELGFEPNQNDSYLRSLQRKEMVRWACLTGDHVCVQKATTLFKSWMDGKLNPYLQRSVQMGSGVKSADSVAVFKAVASTDTGFNIAKEFFINNAEIIEKAYLQRSVQMGSGVKSADSVAVFKAVASTDTGFNIAKEFFINNAEIIEKAVGPVHLEQILEIIASRMNQPRHLKQPLHLPNLSPCDFFFWGHLKDKVYNSNPLTEELKENIHWEIANIPVEPLLLVGGLSTCRETAFSGPSVICEMLTISFQTLSAKRNIDSLAKFMCTSQPVVHRSP
ncbi:hypothetical protein B7P43_G01128 [Cryptotermes secundus]|uniref:Aminopeptidase n=1 Tax=Cryptotermes secundus TaxID=105785 RepID=A0A2J7QZR1_9NEOP|nr:hypothetical protein B7P43_G01128 [Cryptotermes secundus]